MIETKVTNFLGNLLKLPNIDFQENSSNGIPDTTVKVLFTKYSGLDQRLIATKLIAFFRKYAQVGRYGVSWKSLDWKLRYFQEVTLFIK
jgi:hypothetical protein